MPTATFPTVTSTTLIPVDAPNVNRCECGSILVWSRYTLSWQHHFCRLFYFRFQRGAIGRYRAEFELDRDAPLPNWLRL